MPRMVRVLIADDEAPARRRVAELLDDEPAATIVATAASGAEAIAAIRDHAPDVVFLDVQMPDGTGIDVVRAIGVAAMPITVFVTAYDQYALKAFDAAAIDYLVKPFDDERFAEAFRRAREAVDVKDVRRHSSQLLATLQAMQGNVGASEFRAPSPSQSAAPAEPQVASQVAAPTAYMERIAVEGRGQVRVVPVAKVLHITASGPYAEIHTAEKTYLIREQMQVLEDRLDPQKFVRVHRSAIVRLDQVEALRRNGSGDYTVQLRGGVLLKVSRSRSEMLEQRIGLT